MDISQFFIKGDIRGAMEYMKGREEFKDILPFYVSLFEEEKYITYDIPEDLNAILLQYQIYYRDIFYLGMSEVEAAEKLLKSLCDITDTSDGGEEEIGEKLRTLFEGKGYHALFGKTQGLFGPYIWKETVPTLYNVELPTGEAEYKVNILKGFVFRSWMDYLTFGRFGTGGWASPDGTINCIEKAYDFNSERFLVSLLKHEAQHTVDMKEFPGITATELEYRAKLVELHYAENPGLLNKFISEASGERKEDSHSMASERIRVDFLGIDGNDIPLIQHKALELFLAHTEEMKRKYCKA